MSVYEFAVTQQHPFQQIASRLRLASIRSIVIRSLIILCDHIRSKTRLITIMNLIATLVIIYTSLHNRALSEFSCHCHDTQLATTYKQDTGERWGVVSQLQQQLALGLCSVLCWPPPFLSSPARQSSVTAARWPTNSHK